MKFQASKTPSRLRISSTVSRVALAVALTLSANGAMAATSQVHKTIKPAHAAHTRQVAAAKHSQYTQRQFTLPDFIAATFGGFAVPLVTHAAHAARTNRAADNSGGGYDPTFDTPSPTVDVDNSQSQASIDATDQSLQQMDQDIFQMDESLNNNN